MASNATSDQDTLAMRELVAGAPAWAKRGWPNDFRNSLYKRLTGLDPSGEFTIDWWNEIYPTLRAWRATRPYPRATLTARFKERAAEIGAAWRANCAPYVHH